MGSDKQVDLLKQVKVPLWSQWLGAYRAWQRRRNAHKEIHFIATVYAWTWWTDDKYYSYQWYICKVDGAGRRFYEFGYNNTLLKGKETLHSVYASMIAPWMHGGYTHAQLKEFAKNSVKQPIRTE